MLFCKHIIQLPDARPIYCLAIFASTYSDAKNLWGFIDNEMKKDVDIDLFLILYDDLWLGLNPSVINIDLNKSYSSNKRYSIKYGILTQSLSELEKNNFRIVKDLGNKKNVDFKKETLGKIIDKLLSTLVENSGVVQIAPGSMVFRKPSGEKNKVFLRASCAIKDSPSVSLLSWLCYNKIKESNLTPTAILIDTHSIYSIALEISLRIKNLSLIAPEILNFSSYEGINSVPLLDDLSSTFAIISATSSFNLSKKLNRDLKIPISNCITVFSTRKSAAVDEEGHYIHSIHELIGAGGFTNTSYDDPHREIPLGTDSFSPVSTKPRIATLTINSRPAKKTTKFLSSPLNQDAIHISLNSQSPSLWIDLKSLTNSKEFKKWLKNTLIPNIPIGIKFILHSNETDVDKTFAEMIHKAIKFNKPKSNPTLVDYEIFDESNLRDGDCVVCLAAVTKNGDTLMGMNRRIRTNKTIHAKYLSLVTITESNSALEMLQKSLKQSHEYSVNSYMSFLDLPIGTLVNSNPWERELKFLKSLKPCTARNKRINEIEESPFVENIFGIDCNQFKEGFAFWDNIKYNPKLCKNPTILTTIAIVIQKARDQYGPSGLYSTNYESSILDPHTFLRFNDGAILSSILRCAKDSELDYSLTPDVSARMCKLITKTLGSSGNENQGSYELALAFVLGKIKLTQLDSSSVRDLVRSSRFKWLLKSSNTKNQL